MRKFLIPMACTIPAILCTSALGNETVISRISKKFPNALPGKTVVIEKVFDEKSKRIFIRSNHEGIRNASGLFALEQAEESLAKSQNGILHSALRKKIQDVDEDTEIRITISLKHPEGITYLNKFDYPIEELKAQSLAIAGLKPTQSAKAILKRYEGARVLAEGDYSSIVSATRGAIMRMASDENIASISLYTPPKTAARFWNTAALFGQFSIDLNTLARSAYSHSQTALPGNLANNVRAATFESGLNSTFLSCLGVTPAVYDPMPVPFWTFGDAAHRVTDSIHTLVTFTNLVNAAPGAKFYHRRSWTYQNTADQNFIVNNNLATVSMSNDAGEQHPNNPENRAVDDFAHRYPWPVFNTATANAGWMNVPHWAAYNALNTGNVQDSAYEHFKIDTITCGAGATQTKNPIPINGGCIDGGNWPNCAGDREMPYLVVPGYTPIANHSLPPYYQPSDCYMLNETPMTSSCISQGQQWGTSMSVPTLNGMVASLLGQNGYLIYKPELVRAIILNTSRNVHGTLWEQYKDGKDGAGVIHGADAISFAGSISNVNPGNSAVTKAYNYSYYCESDFSGGGSRTFNISIPNPKPSGQHLRIVFTWDSFPDLTNSTNLLPDIDIFITTNSGTKYSYSWDSNIEILDIDPSDVTAGGSYSVTVNPLTWRRTSGARGTCSYAALTWGFVTTNAH